MNRLSASEAAKSAGLPSLNHIQQVTGVRRGVLDDWNKHKTRLFDTVVAGCAVFEALEALQSSHTFFHESVIRLEAELKVDLHNKGLQKAADTARARAEQLRSLIALAVAHHDQRETQ